MKEDNAVNRQSYNISFVVAVAFHIAMALFLFISFERTISIPAHPFDPNKEIIDAVMINSQSLKAEVARLDALEAKKQAQEQARVQELVRQENEAKQKRHEEEAMAEQLKKKNEQLKKEVEQQRLAQLKEDQTRQLKLKAEQEELKKIQKEKEIALKEKQKAQEVQKAAEAAKQKELAQENAAQQTNQRVKQDQITHYATLMRNKIHQNWRQPIGMEIVGFTCKIAVTLLPTGEVVEANVVVSSGNVEFDRSTELAIRKASPLPMPTEASIAKEFRQFTFTFHPEAV